jgi:HD superfamily phosphodiesterase
VDGFPHELRWFTALVAAAAVLAAAVFGALDDAFPIGAVVLCGALALYTAQRHVKLSNGVHLSPAFMVCMAAVVVCASSGSLLGAMIVGACSGIRLEHFARGRRAWLPFNTACAGVSFLAAAAVYDLFPEHWQTAIPIGLAAVIPAAVAYFAVAWGLLVFSYVVEGTRPWRVVLAELVPTGLEAIPFAVLGFFLGRLYLDIGPAAMLMIVVPILIAREMFASYMKVKEAHEETVQMLVRALEAKDRYTAGHAERVAAYARYIGQELNFMPGRLERLRFAALMHDIGKLVVPNQLLNKPGKLTAEEFARVRVHESVSVQMLSHIDFLRPIAKVSHSDHTRFDPDNTDHPIEPYIVMIADAYDAMTSTRSYRKALAQDVAFQELRDKSGVQFHPECVEALIRAVENRGEKHGAGFEVAAHFEHAPDAGLGSAGLGDLLTSESA